MPRTAQQNEEIRRATKTSIVNSAMTLFAQHGYAHTTTRKIAQQAGISTGLFYMLRSQPAIMDVLGDSVRSWSKRLRDLFIAEFNSLGHPESELDALILCSLIEGINQQYLLDPANYPLEIVGNRIIDQFGT